MYVTLKDKENPFELNKLEVISSTYYEDHNIILVYDSTIDKQYEVLEDDVDWVY